MIMEENNNVNEGMYNDNSMGNNMNNNGGNGNAPAFVTLLVCSILSCCCCCPITGIAGIILTIIANNNYKEGDLEGYESKKKIAIITVVAGVILTVIINIAYFAIAGVSAFDTFKQLETIGHINY